MIAVRDLATASAGMEDAGFVVQPGGRHVGFGTENAIVRLGLDYLELITVHDRDQARRASARSKELAEFLDRYEDGLVGFALAPERIGPVVDGLRASGHAPYGPTAMRRERPDGRTLEWTLVIPNEVAWRRPWPFFIAWSLPDTERLAIEPPPAHPLGVTAVVGIGVAVGDLAETRRLYDAVVGRALSSSPTRATYAVGQTDIELIGPGDSHFPGLDRGPGPFFLRLRTSRPDVRGTRAVLTSVALTFE